MQGLPKLVPSAILDCSRDEKGGSASIMSSATGSALQSAKFGLLVTAFGGLLFTLDLPLLRLAAADKWTMVFVRGLLLFVAISLSWLMVRLHKRDNAPFIAGWAGLAVIATNSIANIAYIRATVETYAANVVFILALVPVLTAIFSRLFIGERIGLFAWLASILAFLGVFVIVRDGLQTDRIQGDLFALLCACCTAAAFTIIRGSGKNVATSLGLGSLVSALVAIAFFPINLGSLLPVSNLGMPAWVWLALNGLVVIPIASTLIANGPRYLPSVDVSMFFLLETVLTPVWVWMLFGEKPTTNVLVGGGIIILTLLAHSSWRLHRGLQGNA
jgi:drug/metabolite transporter (DMT)-like permease